eukprot:CAMPEP_0115645224 /NCGR_PEP_ID=MMETSP0272-20121206/38292_1 /TAXON_ID=71861 /ORGANISM="Scrippsiella trochoidea, Strain CCMP3099" /LENGTH=123 /DNA_ID=CAMNT_0003082689 /DNA_START=36 /DNA_END=407 /DNA_ORIENTATION=+
MTITRMQHGNCCQASNLSPVLHNTLLQRHKRGLLNSASQPTGGATAKCSVHASTVHSVCCNLHTSMQAKMKGVNAVFLTITMHTVASTTRAAAHAPTHQIKTVHALEVAPWATTLTSAPCSNT